MKILITGCAGFIGINFTKYWLAEHRGDEVVGVDCLTYAANLDELSRVRENPAFVFYKADISSAQSVNLIFEREKPDTVLNFAAESHVDRSIASAEIFIRSNVLGTQCLLDACLRYGVRRFHQISTDEVYGDLPLDSAEQFTEGSPLKPSSPYSASKAAADLLVLSYFRTPGLFVTVSRSSNNYGPYQHTEKLIPHTVDAIRRGEDVSIYGNGQNIRDWLYVHDHVTAVEAILQNGSAGEIYNVGGGEELTNLEVVGYIMSAYENCKSKIKFVEDRKGHDRKYSLDTSKIRNQLGWKPQYRFREQIKSLISE